jgi:hypothetical protein
MDAMLELDAHNWVSLINESRVSASWVINSNLSTMFCKQRDELVLRKQAELNAIQRKSLSKTKIDGYEMPSFLKTLTLDRFKSLSVIVSYLSDFIKICSVSHILIFSLDEPEVSSNT